MASRVTPEATKKRTPCNVGRAAEILMKSVDAVYQGVHRRQIPHRRVGRRIYFFEEELAQFLEDAPGVRLEDLDR